jgi:hypothetical protein
VSEKCVISREVCESESESESEECGSSREPTTTPTNTERLDIAARASTPEKVGIQAIQLVRESKRAHTS